MPDMPIIAIGGENLIDHVTRDGEVTAKAGGSPFNVAMAMGRQGAAVHYISPISTDDWGATLAATLSASNVALTGGRVSAPTTMARVTITDGIPSYVFERDGTAERAVTHEDLAARIAPAAALHTGSLALTDGADADVWEETMAAAGAAGQFLSLDPNVRLSIISDIDAYRARILRMMAQVDLLKLSDEDLEGLYPGLSEADAMADIQSRCGAGLIVLTRGADGARGWIGGARFDLASAPVAHLVDTVGAGDTFMATMLARLAETGCLTRAALVTMGESGAADLLTRAGVAAALNCGREGCDPPSRAELEAALG